MSTLKFEVPEEQVARLERAAHEEGIPLEALLRKLANDYLDRKGMFEAATQYVLHKNAELYRRLAQ